MKPSNFWGQPSVMGESTQTFISILTGLTMQATLPNFDLAAKITTPLALLSLIVLVLGWLARGALDSQKAKIDALPDAEKADAIKAELDRNRLDYQGLTRDQRYNLWLKHLEIKEMQNRRWMQLGALLMILFSALAALAFWKNGGQSSESTGIIEIPEGQTITSGNGIWDYSGKTVKIGKTLTVQAKHFKLIAGKLIARDLTIDGQPSGSLAAPPAPQAARPGTDGQDDGQRGQNGSDGLPGAKGSPGASGSNVTLDVNSIEGDLTVNVSGQPGGPGGIGGAGGFGGNGHKGANGSDSLTGCKRSGQPGGTGGEGGKGGTGGEGGLGGNAGVITITAKKVTGELQLYAKGGEGGAPGLPGTGGASGNSGSGGSGSTYCSGGSTGLPGQEGAKGDPGIKGAGGQDGRITLAIGSATTEEMGSVSRRY